MPSLPLGIFAVVVLFAAVVVWFAYARMRDDLAAEASIAAALRASEAKFAGILEIAMDAIITIDVTQRVLHFNHGAERIFGYAAAEVVGQPLGMLLPERFRGGHAGMVRGFAGAPEPARQMADRREIFGLRPARRDGVPGRSLDLEAGNARWVDGLHRPAP